MLRDLPNVILRVRYGAQIPTQVWLWCDFWVLAGHRGITIGSSFENQGQEKPL